MQRLRMLLNYIVNIDGFITRKIIMPRPVKNSNVPVLPRRTRVLVSRHGPAQIIYCYPLCRINRFVLFYRGGLRICSPRLRSQNDHQKHNSACQQAQYFSVGNIICHLAKLLYMFFYNNF